MIRRALALALLTACAPAMNPEGAPRSTARSAGHLPGTPSGTPLRAPDAAVDGPAEHARTSCPVTVENPTLVLARVGLVVITACDLALEQLHRTRNGLPEAPPRALFDALVRDALVASTQTPRPHDPEIDAVLADALVRRDALDAMAHDMPDDARVERYYREHLEDLSRPERVRLRALGFSSERSAREALRTLRNGSSFEDLISQRVDPLARRDQGDLGWLTRDTRGDTHGVAPGIITAGFALGAIGDLSPNPVAVTVRVTVRRRSRAVTTWHVVELTDREPAVTPSLADVRRRIAHRLTRDRYLGLRREARTRWGDQLEAAVRAAIDDRALASVHIEGP